MQLHSNAATCPRQRQLIRSSALSMRTVARNLGVSPSPPFTPGRIVKTTLTARAVTTKMHYALQEEEESLLLWLRQTGQMSLDDLFDLMAPSDAPSASVEPASSATEKGLQLLTPKNNNSPQDTWSRSRSIAPAFCTSTAFTCPNLMDTRRTQNLLLRRH